MECRDVKSRLSEYVDGVLDDNESSQVRAHVETCPDCAKMYASMTRLIGFMRETESVDEPADFLVSVRARLDSRSSPGDIVRRWLGTPVTSMPLKAAAVALVVVLLVHLPGDLRERPPVELPSSIDAEKRVEITTNDSRGRRDEPAPSSKKNEVGELMLDQFAEERPSEIEGSGVGGTPTGRDEDVLAEVGRAKSTGDEAGDAEVGLYEDKLARAAGAEEIDSDFDQAKDRTISRTAEAPLREVVQAMAGTVVESEYDEGKNRVVALVVEIPEDNYDAFIEELDRLENVTLDQPASPKEQAEPVKSAPTAKSAQPAGETQPVEPAQPAKSSQTAESVLSEQPLRSARASTSLDSLKSPKTMTPAKSDTTITAGKAAEMEASEKTKKRADKKRTVTVRIYLR
jgi:hypothetical protein